MGITLYFDLVSGASGDMILAALVNIGVPVRHLNAELKKLAIPGLTLSAEAATRSGIACTQMKMRWTTPKSYRHLPDILALIKKARFSESIVARSTKVLDRLAEAEARAHGIPKDHVHFHELGAVDTIIDIVGTCIALDYLGVDTILFSSLTEGHGTIKTEHGVMPVPAPATANLMQGLHVTRLDVPTELLTPTGCAILTTLGTQALVCPAGTVKKTGNGCGTKEFDNHPNFLRVLLLETQSASQADTTSDTVEIFETDMDHLSGEILGNVAALLMEKGALDVSYTPIFMKKGRPGFRLTVIAAPADGPTLVDLIMLHTRSLGVRHQTMHRVIAHRETKPGTFEGHAVTEKFCSYKGHSFTKMENEDVARIAREENSTIIEVMERYCKEKGKGKRR